MRMLSRFGVRLLRWAFDVLRGEDPWVSAQQRLPMFAGTARRGSDMFMPMHRSKHHRMGPMFMVFVLFESIFWGAAATCFLCALHRIAAALHTEARIAALRKMSDAYTDEEREVLVHKIKSHTLRCM